VVGDRAVRVQHRSGSLWVLSSAALRAVGLDPATHDGRLFRSDRWLRDRIPHELPDLSTLGLERFGVVGVTDMTPYDDVADLDALGGAIQHVVATGGPALAQADFPAPLIRGPVKIVVADHELPDLDQLVTWIRGAHAAHRTVAVHAVTRVALALTIAAIDVVGTIDGDRIEHGSVVPPSLRDAIARLRLTVVTQPAFLRARGDRYLAEADAVDVPHLYPCASLPRVAGSTDAPYGPEDPWTAIAAAVDRRTASGAVVGPDEAVSPERALGLFLGAWDDPAGPRRRIEPGAPADLCLLDRATGGVAATWIGGALVWDG
jgi:predicted amidohydrolase YtcJ